MYGLGLANILRHECAHVLRQKLFQKGIIVNFIKAFDSEESKVYSLHFKVPDEQERHKPSEQDLVSTHSVKLAWREGKSAPETIVDHHGVALAYNNAAFFSHLRGVFMYTISENKWAKLKKSKYVYFSMAVIYDQLTTIGGCSTLSTGLNSLLSLSGESTSTMKWEAFFPPMPTKRLNTSAITTSKHLVVAGGMEKLLGDPIPTVEILNIRTHQWATASCLPLTSSHHWPDVTLCNGYLYLNQNGGMFSCSVEKLLKSCRPTNTSSCDDGSAWTRLADIPLSDGTSLATVRGHVLAIGGIHKGSIGNPVIHRYNKRRNSWNFVGEMPTQRYNTLVAVLKSNEVVVVGGETDESDHGSGSKLTEIITVPK